MAFSFSPLANEVGHFFRDFQAELNEAGILAIDRPGRLVDQLFHAALFDRVDVGLAAGEHLGQFGTRCFGVAVEDVGADDRAAALGRCGGPVVQFQENTIFVTNGDVARKFLHPAIVHGRSGSFSVWGVAPRLYQPKEC